MHQIKHFTAKSIIRYFASVGYFMLTPVVYLSSWRDDRFGIDSMTSLNNKIPKHEWRKVAYTTGSILIMDQF